MVIFSVIVEGMGFMYQWFKNDVVINGVIGVSYIFVSVVGNDQGQYKVVVINDFGGWSISVCVEFIVDIVVGIKILDGFVCVVIGGGNCVVVMVMIVVDFKIYVEQMDFVVIMIFGMLNVVVIGNLIWVKFNKMIQGIDVNVMIIGSIFIGEGIEKIGRAHV